MDEDRKNKLHVRIVYNIFKFATQFVAAVASRQVSMYYNVFDDMDDYDNPYDPPTGPPPPVWQPCKKCEHFEQIAWGYFPKWWCNRKHTIVLSDARGCER